MILKGIILRNLLNSLPSDQVTFTTGFSVQEPKRSVMEAATLGLMKGKPVVQVTLSATTASGTTTVIFQESVKIQATAQELLQKSSGEKTSTKTHSYVPLSVTSGSTGTSSSSEVVYVKASDLVKNLKLGSNMERHIRGRVEGSEQQADALSVTTFVENRVKMEQEKFFLHDSCKQKLNQPVQESARSQTATFVSTCSRLSSSQLENIQHNQTFIQERTAGSNSIKKGGQALENWKSAASTVEKMALENKKLTFAAVCGLNSTLYKGIKMDDPEKVPGTMRDHPVFIGGMGGPRYVHQQFLEGEMKELIDWINSQVQSCQKGKANPVEVAALAYQKMVSLHPFSDGNGRTCRLVMDYILQSSGLPPAVLGDNVDVAVLGTQDQDTSRISKTPTDAVMTVLQGVQNAYTLMEQNK